MDYPKFIVSNQKEESTSIQRVKTIPSNFQLISSKAQLEKEVGRLWDRVHVLWERLEVPLHEQELFSEGKQGFKPDVIEAVSSFFHVCNFLGFHRS